MDNEITAKERGLLEEDNEKEEQEGGDEHLKEEADQEEEKEEHESLTEEQELEELRAQVLQLLLELEEARETSSKHQESFQELQGQTTDSHTTHVHSFFRTILATDRKRRSGPMHPHAPTTYSICPAVSMHLQRHSSTNQPDCYSHVTRVTKGNNNKMHFCKNMHVNASSLHEINEAMRKQLKKQPSLCIETFIYGFKIFKG